MLEGRNRELSLINIKNGIRPPVSTNQTIITKSQHQFHMSTITHHIPVTTGQAHHMTLRLVQSYGAPAALSDYTVYGSILQDGETVPVSVTGTDATGILLTLPPLYPGSHPYNLHLKHNTSGTDYLFLQGNCDVSELIGADTLDNTAIEQITVTLKDDLSGVTVTVQIHSDVNVQPYPDMESLLNNPEFLQRLKEACGIPALEEVLTTKADAATVAMALAAKADTTALEAGLASKPDTAAMKESLALKANQTDLETGLAAKADTTALTAYIPYAKIGRALTKAADGKVDVDLSNYTGTTVNIIGTTSACIGRNTSDRLAITAASSIVQHNIKSELNRGATYITVTTGQFVLESDGNNSAHAYIRGTSSFLDIQAYDEIAMRSNRGNYPGLCINGEHAAIIVRKNSSTSRDQLAYFGNTGTAITYYTNFYNGHN